MTFSITGPQLTSTGGMGARFLILLRHAWTNWSPEVACPLPTTILAGLRSPCYSYLFEFPRVRVPPGGFLGNDPITLRTAKTTDPFGRLGRQAQRRSDNAGRGYPTSQLQLQVPYHRLPLLNHFSLQEDDAGRAEELAQDEASIDLHL